MKYSIDTTVLFKNTPQGLFQTVEISIFENTAIVAEKLDISFKGFNKTIIFKNKEHSGNRIRFEIPEITEPVRCKTLLHAGGNQYAGDFLLTPKRKWEVHVQNFSHTDIGYTDLPSRVVKSYKKAIGSILDYCDLTEGLDDDCKYRWNVETGYWLENAVRGLSEKDTARLGRLVTEGRIELCPLYVAHTSEYNDTETLIRSLYKTFEFAGRLGSQIKTAMASDSAGQPIFFPQLLTKAGIKYFSTAVNATMAKAPALPRPFYWQGPDGSRILLMDTDERQAYQEGVVTGISESYENTLRKLPAYLADLEEENKYLFDLIALRTPGHSGDNSLPNIAVSYIVKKWNEIWEYPKLKISTYSRFFEKFEAVYGDSLKTYTGAWPDWWVLYNGASAFETGVNRRTHSSLAEGERFSSILDFLSPGNNEYPYKEIEETYTQILLADEADWGSYSSVSEPDSLQSRGQKFEEAAFVYQAAINAEEIDGSARLQLAENSGSCRESVMVTNSLSWGRTGIVVVDIPLSIADGGIEITDPATGEVLPSQKLLQTGDTRDIRLAFQAKNIPALGYKNFLIRKGEATETTRLYADGILENSFYRLDYNIDTGIVTSIIDKETGKELIDAGSQWSFNQLIYETPEEGRNVSLKDHSPLPEDVIFLQPYYRKIHHFYDYPQKSNPLKRLGSEKSTLVSVTKGSLYSEITTQYSAHICPKGISRIILDNLEKRIIISNYLEKTETLEPEGLYYAFPFHSKNPEISLDAHGGYYEPEKGQIPGSCRDWYCSQKWVNILGEEVNIIWSAIEAPLIQLGEIRTGRWLDSISIDNGTLYSFIMNNYWWTNSSASQGGRFTFNYAFSSGPPEFRAETSTAFGWEQHFPLKGIVADHCKKTPDIEEAFGFFTDTVPANLIVTCLKNADSGVGIIIRLLEISGKKSSFTTGVTGKQIKRAILCDPVERAISEVQPVKGKIRIESGPFEMTTIRIETA